MHREITLDSANDRLVFLMSAPDRDYWEDLWRPLLTGDSIARGDRFVVAETVRVLDRGSRLVDAGCGIGATVHGLAQAGFDAYGIDYAEETVDNILSHFPDLQVQVADVRSMPFETGSIDGVWSLGVIEHFYDGYDSLIEEAYRVLRPGGYLFLTVPSISPLKSIKCKLGLYPRYDERDRERFFQFAFRPQQVALRVGAHGFDMVRGFGRSGAFGFTEDAATVAQFLLLRKDWRSLPARAWWRLADRLLTSFSYHTYYFLFRKQA